MMDKTIAAEQVALQVTSPQDPTRLAEVRDVLADVFSVEPAAVEAAKSFTDELDADSLLGIELLTHLEIRFGIAIKDEEVPRLMTDLATAYQVVAESAGW